MKKNILLSAFIFISILSFSQTNKTIQWKELEAFHDIVGPVFHSAEKGNFHATYDSAKLVLERATNWQSSSIPAGLDEKTFHPLLDKLVAECKDLNEAVKSNKKDIELKPLLRKAHNTFHEILAKYDKSSHQ